MCGDFENDESMAEEFYARFVDHTRSFLANLKGAVAEEEGDSLYVYLDSLFRDTLTAATENDRAPANISGYERLSMEPLVYARSAGFMAAQQPLENDPLRRLIEAMMTGYAEGAAIASDHADLHQHHFHDHAH